VVSYSLGVLALHDPDFAAAAAVSAAAVLAFRTRLHSLARDALSQQEVLDGLLLAVAAVVVLPILPDHPVGPLGAINPARVWRLVVLVMAVGIAGHLGTRFFGSRFGIPLAGLAGGLVSNTATIGSMGALARREPQLVPAAASAAMLGSFASLVQLTLVIGAADVRVLQALQTPLIAAGVAAGASAIVLSLHSLRAPADAQAPNGRSVDLTSAIAFAAVVSVTLIVVAALHRWLGERGVLIGVALGGTADVHAAAISAASLAARGELPPQSAALPILAALTANTAVKIGIAFTSGPRSYFARVGIGLALLVSTAWIAALF